MEIYQAPLEGITRYVFRESQSLCFGGIDKYFTPFITPAVRLGGRSRIDVLPENNAHQRLVPQILTDNAQGFVSLCDILSEFGYDEFNLNLGCPSGTVVSKGRGAGFLARTEELDRFLDFIFKSSHKISVKTRIGFERADEFYRLLEIYNQYPISELIIHPRTRTDMYENTPNLDIFEYAAENAKMPLCYNGDIFDLDTYCKFKQRFPNINKIMLGRGLVMNPALALIIKGEGRLDIAKLREFYDDIYNGYGKLISGDKQLMFKMKELLLYLVKAFNDSEKAAKAIKKAKNLDALRLAVQEMFLRGIKE